MHFKNADSGIVTPAAVVSSDLSIDLDIVTGTPPRVTVASRAGQGLSTFLTPTHVLTPDNISKAHDISRQFLRGRVLVVGKESISAFFSSLTGKKTGSKGAEQRRLVAEQVVKALENK